jgi:hypothetical protein
VSFKQVPVKLSLTALLLLSLASCSNSPVGNSLRGAFSADPRLKVSPSANAPASPIALPPKFPPEVPKYPNATLQEAQSTGEFPTESSADLITRWTSNDSSDRVLGFYRDELQKNGWKIDQQAPDNSQGSILASREGLKLIVGIQPSGQATNFSIETKTDGNVAQSPDSGAPKPGDSNFVGPVSSTQPASPAPNAQAQTFPDLDKAPQELRQYAKDLAQLGILTPFPTKNKANSDLFEPNKGITRRVYARWLVAANNRIFANRPARQIHLGVETAQPAYRDVSAKDPDFPAIQGLAEAGLIPSSLSGDSTAVLFRPDAPLSREELILWKVPVDTRQPLPGATIDAVRQLWGFQDVARIDPKALRAVLADSQNGDQANIRRAFGYTTLFQPKRQVTRAEAAAVLWHFGFQGDAISAQEALKGKAP